MGTLVEVGSLGVMSTGEGGFDISPDNEVALASGAQPMRADGVASCRATNAPRKTHRNQCGATRMEAV